MMHMMVKQPSTSISLPMILEIVLVTPIAPSPMTIMVSKLIRSMRCVFLKLSMRQMQEMAIVMMDSATMTP